MDCSPPGSSVHGVFQAVRLECVAMPSSPPAPTPWHFLCLMYRNFFCLGSRCRVEFLGWRGSCCTVITYLCKTAVSLYSPASPCFIPSFPTACLPRLMLVKSKSIWLTYIIWYYNIHLVFHFPHSKLCFKICPCCYGYFHLFPRSGASTLHWFHYPLILDHWAASSSPLLHCCDEHPVCSLRENPV